MKKIILLLLLCLSSQFLVGQRQSYKGYMAAGDAAVEQRDFYSAYQFYRVATEYPGKDNDPEALYKVGKMATLTRAYRVAQTSLTRLASLPAVNDYPDYAYYLGEAFYRVGQYDQAVIHYEKYVADNPDGDADLLFQASNRIEQANWAIEAETNRRDITLNHLPEQVNSEYSDVAYTIAPGGTPYFTSNRFKFKKDTVNPRRKLSRVLQRSGNTETQELAKEINQAGKLIAHSAFNAAGNRVYYSVCQYVDYDNISCDIYRADVDEKGKWQNPSPLAMNGDDFTAQMPNVGMDTDGQEYLYYASNQSGGKGRLDIYRAPINEDGSIGTPLNLEAINTPGNDATPFFYGPKQTLYFSSDRVPTFGGLDVFKSYFVDGTFFTPENIGAPVNSAADDAYYSRFEGEPNAFVSSTRQTTQAIFFDENKEVCCYDIYQFPPDERLDLLVTTFNGFDQEPLVATKVTLYERTPSGLVPIKTIENPTGNDFSFKLTPGKSYEIHGEKDGFSSVIEVLDLSDESSSTQTGLITRKLYLNPKVDLEVLTYNSNDGKPLEGVTVGLYRIENGQEILLEELTNEGGNDFSFPLEYGNTYLIKGTRPDFGAVTKTIDLSEMAPDGTKVIRERLDLGQLLRIFVIDAITEEPLTNATVDLSRVNGERVAKKTNPTGNDFEFTINLNRQFKTVTEREDYYTREDILSFTEADLAAGDGQLSFIIPLYPRDINRLLPLNVYFDNDHPNPRSTRRTTNLSYAETYVPYFEQRNTFIEEFTAALDEEEAFTTRRLYNNFFDRRVKGGWDQLKAFTVILEQHLAAGNVINLKIQGFASPRAATEYNRRLSSRRIESVINYFKSYGEGVLLPYITNQQLSFTKDPRGETADPKVVSDRLDDPRQSIFSLAASQERKVEVSNSANAINRKK